MAGHKANDFMLLRGDVALTGRQGVLRTEPARKITGNPVFPVFDLTPFPRANQRRRRYVTGIRNPVNHSVFVLLNVSFRSLVLPWQMRGAKKPRIIAQSRPFNPRIRTAKGK